MMCDAFVAESIRYPLLLFIRVCLKAVMTLPDSLAFSFLFVLLSTPAKIVVYVRKIFGPYPYHIPFQAIAILQSKSKQTL